MDRLAELVYDWGMFSQVSGIGDGVGGGSPVEVLAAAIEGLSVPVDGDELVTVLGLRDRLDARIAEAVAAFDSAELWDAEGATSMTAWLADRAAMTRRRAAVTAATARKLAVLPHTAEAWRTGRLSGGQIDAIVANLDRDTVGLFADHETDVVPALAGLTPAEVATAMRTWRAHATQDRQPPAEPERAVHLSPTLTGRWALDGTLDPETGEIVATALRLATTGDVEGEPARTPSERRADALGDVCRFFLDHQHTHRGGRHRPHLNVVAPLDALTTPPDHTAAVAAQTVTGTELDLPTLLRVGCDCTLHRLVTGEGRGTIDYGRLGRTIPAPLWNALVVRDRTCRFPGCDRPPSWCEGHHVRHWAHGGPTTLANLALVCSRHHHRLHHPGWHAKLLPDATLEVTDPGGRVRTTHPPDPTRAPPLPLAA
jgi:hypothetical protein